MSNQPNQGFSFHIHDNPDLPWWNLTPLSASIAADVAGNQWWVLFPAPGAASQAVPRPFICAITMQRAEIRHTVRATSLRNVSPQKTQGVYDRTRRCVCAFAFLFVFKPTCVLSLVRAVECQNCSSLAQTLLAALHSNQIARHGAQRVWALKFSQVKSHVGGSLCACELQRKNMYVCVPAPQLQRGHHGAIHTHSLWRVSDKPHRRQLDVLMQTRMFS